MLPFTLFVKMPPLPPAENFNTKYTKGGIRNRAKYFYGRILVIVLTHLCPGKTLQKDTFQSSAPPPRVFVQMIRSLREKIHYFVKQIKFFDLTNNIDFLFF